VTPRYYQKSDNDVNETQINTATNALPGNFGNIFYT